MSTESSALTPMEVFSDFSYTKCMNEETLETHTSRTSPRRSFYRLASSSMKSPLEVINEDTVKDVSSLRRTGSVSPDKAPAAAHLRISYGEWSAIKTLRWHKEPRVSDDTVDGDEEPGHSLSESKSHGSSLALSHLTSQGSNLASFLDDASIDSALAEIATGLGDSKTEHESNSWKGHNQMSSTNQLKPVKSLSDLLSSFEVELPPALGSPDDQLMSSTSSEYMRDITSCEESLRDRRVRGSSAIKGLLLNRTNTADRVNMLHTNSSEPVRGRRSLQCSLSTDFSYLSLNS
ncbi:hypothetical protein CEUSTIGMA_g561.t1 [Chlamydomonas eustigma]|uniref:Uncharacterized protein n=1 Tax=Chlamydomonas eustigma TaxID=1157962 RepID=A0A250WQK9_9CHLO|nr:hypothetical protein CEUSTIGMA_g561.t1 [Chlamydomonas eustigma]|eukprot:GAX73108.1 hypothetical protein CEUSTIGMA_g561.t1 [Chlamydomonas eustigma]